MKMASGVPTLLTLPPVHSASQPANGKLRDSDVAGMFAAMLSFGSNTSAKLHTQTMADAEQMFQAKGADGASEHDSLHDGSDDKQKQSEPLSVRTAKTEPQVELAGDSENRKSLAPSFVGGRSAGANMPQVPTARPEATERLRIATPVEIGSPRQAMVAPSALVPGVAAPSSPAAPPPAVSISSTVSANSSPALQVAEMLKGTTGTDNGRSSAMLEATQNTRGSTSEVASFPKGKEPQSRSQNANIAEQTPEIETPKFDELVKSLRLQMGGKQSSARLRLQPPELGHLRVDVKVLGDRVRIDVQTETDAARALLSRRAEQLKTGLESQGIRLERLEVVLNNSAANADAVGSAGLPPAMPARPDEVQRPRGSQHDKDHTSARRRTSRSGVLSVLNERLDVNG